MRNDGNRKWNPTFKPLIALLQTNTQLRAVEEIHIIQVHI